VRPLPLAGVRVLAVEQYGAGPFGTQHLADLGAEIIKVENVADGGDISRGVGPHTFPDGSSQFFEAFNRNKKSIALDLKDPQGREVLLRLVATADAVFNNLRGDVPARIGLDYASLAQANPKVVCVHLSAYGREGSRAAWPGYDYLMQAEAGYLSLTGEPDGPPARAGLSIIDFMAGTTAALALVSGLVQARSEGQGRDLDVSLFDVALNNLAYVATWMLNAGATTTRLPRSSHPSLTPSQLYRTADGWIFLMCNKEKFWRTLTEAIDRPDLADNAAYRDFAARLQNRDALTVELDAALSARTTAAWLERFAGRVPAAPVHDVEQALSTPFVAERGCVLETENAQRGTVRSLASPIRVDGSEPPRHIAPALGEDTDEVLGAAGYSAEEIASLRAGNVVR